MSLTARAAWILSALLWLSLAFNVAFIGLAGVGRLIRDDTAEAMPAPATFLVFRRPARTATVSRQQHPIRRAPTSLAIYHPFPTHPQFVVVDGQLALCGGSIHHTYDCLSVPELLWRMYSSHLTLMLSLGPLLPAESKSITHTPASSHLHTAAATILLLSGLGVVLSVPPRQRQQSQKSVTRCDSGFLDKPSIPARTNAANAMRRYSAHLREQGTSAQHSRRWIAHRTHRRRIVVPRRTMPRWKLLWARDALRERLDQALQSAYSRHRWKLRFSGLVRMRGWDGDQYKVYSGTDLLSDQLKTCLLHVYPQGQWREPHVFPYLGQGRLLGMFRCAGVVVVILSGSV